MVYSSSTFGQWFGKEKLKRPIVPFIEKNPAVPYSDTLYMGLWSVECGLYGVVVTKHQLSDQAVTKIRSPLCLFLSLFLFLTPLFLLFLPLIPLLDNQCAIQSCLLYHFNLMHISVQLY